MGNYSAWGVVWCIERQLLITIVTEYIENALLYEPDIVSFTDPIDCPTDVRYIRGLSMLLAVAFEVIISNTSSCLRSCQLIDCCHH